MRLICRKCDKEIIGYLVEYTNHFKSLSTKIRVVCHDAVDIKHVWSSSSGFSPSDYGDICFFEKEKPETATELMAREKAFGQKWKKQFEEMQAPLIDSLIQGLYEYEAKGEKEEPKGALDSLKGPPFVKTDLEVKAEKLEALNNRLVNDNIVLKKRVGVLELENKQHRHDIRRLESSCEIYLRDIKAL